MLISSSQFSAVPRHMAFFLKLILLKDKYAVCIGVFVHFVLLDVTDIHETLYEVSF
jgi:hypothetical protein